MRKGLGQGGLDKGGTRGTWGVGAKGWGHVHLGFDPVGHLVGHVIHIQVLAGWGHPDTPVGHVVHPGFGWLAICG